MSELRNQEDVGKLVHVSTDGAIVEANLSIPEGAKGIVLFAHGTGSSRHSPRNNFVADELRDGGLATLLIDLMTPEEKEIDRRTRQVRFDINRLARRVVGATDWLLEQPETQDLNLGYFGSSTGAAGALIAATERPNVVKAIVSRGGRVDLAGAVLDQVRAPTLFIVGGNDYHVLELNRQALQRLTSEKSLEVVTGAGHLFEEPGALDEVARLAREWFQEHLTS
ncbi:MAG: dienelactone hydrolase family protein [Chloroflexota bacterium]|nr:dienelactone hydrolase family protein [Chloroflexota bacterium]